MDRLLPKDFKNLIKNLLRPLCHELRYLLCTKKKAILFRTDKITVSFLSRLVENLSMYLFKRKSLKKCQPIQVKTSEKWTRVFDSALSHTCRSDASEKKRRKYLRPLLAKFVCGQFLSPRLYRLNP